MPNSPWDSYFGRYKCHISLIFMYVARNLLVVLRRMHIECMNAIGFVLHCQNRAYDKAKSRMIFIDPEKSMFWHIEMLCYSCILLQLLY